MCAEVHKMPFGLSVSLHQLCKCSKTFGVEQNSNNWTLRDTFCGCMCVGVCVQHLKTEKVTKLAAAWLTRQAVNRRLMINPTHNHRQNYWHFSWHARFRMSTLNPFTSHICCNSQWSYFAVHFSKSVSSEENPASPDHPKNKWQPPMRGFIQPLITKLTCR